MRNALRSGLCIASTLLLAIATTACSDDDDFEDGAAVDDAIAEGEARGATLASQTEVEVAGDTPPVIAAKSGGIMIAINEGEILQAETILDLGGDPAVLDYAQRMIDEHSLNNEQLLQVLTGIGVTPIDSPVAAALREEALAGVDLLERADDPDFEYIRMQVVMHSEAIVIVDALQNLAPYDPLAQFFSDTLLVIEDHRAAAEELLRLFTL